MEVYNTRHIHGDGLYCKQTHRIVNGRWQPTYTVYLVTSLPLGVVQREATYETDKWHEKPRNVVFVTPDGKKHQKLKDAAHHLLEVSKQ